MQNGERSPLAPPGRAGRTATVSGRAPVIDGETQLLRLLFESEECREPGLELDDDLFEDSGNRELYFAWREHPGLASGLEAAFEDLEEELRERAEALLARPLPPHDPAELAAMVSEIATRLRDRRQHARLRERTTDVAEELVAARRIAAESTNKVEDQTGIASSVQMDKDAEISGTDTMTGDVTELAAELDELGELQRRLARETASIGDEIIKAGATRDRGG